jgi:DNA-binding NarL/FixJ family response regulator
MGNEPLKLVLLEDQTMFRDLIVRTLRQALDVSVVGAFATAAELQDNLAAAKQADVALLDIRLGAEECFDLIPKLRAAAPGLKLMWVTSVLEDVLLKRAFEANLPGFIHKEDSADELITAVQRVAAGHAYLSSSVRRYRESLLGRPDLFSKVLSRREQEVLKVIGGGFSNEEAAALLGLSAETVKSHRRNIMARLDLHSSAELQAYAVRHGFVSARALK